MLVLSRRENEQILFPSLGITLEVLRVKGNTTRIGISAPDDVPIQRAELQGLKSLDFTAETPEENFREKLQRTGNAVKERLDAASVWLNRLHQTLEEAGNAPQGSEAEARLFAAFKELRTLDREVRDIVTPKPAKPKTRQAMLIEDDANESHLTAGLLRMSGFEVITCTDGHDALDYLSMHSAPDVVLLDMFLPNCDGPTFVRHVRQSDEHAELKLIALSGAESRDVGVPIGPGGVDRWFIKPVNPEKLVEEVCEEIQSTTA